LQKGTKYNWLLRALFEIRTDNALLVPILEIFFAGIGKQETKTSQDEN